jgi:glutathione S-transferase
MYQLYYKAGACSLAPHVVLNELSVKFELIDAYKDGKKTPEFLAANPRGQVPVLVDDGHVIREGGAILSYLCDQNKSPLLPREGKERATALEWLMFCNATLHPAFSRLFGASSLPADMKEKATELAVANVNKLWQEVEARLSQSPYLAGNDITVGDILLTVIGNWSANFPTVHVGQATKKLFSTVSKRPSYQKAMAEEKIEYKAAA